MLGYTLGGGVSWFGRSHGLAANSVVAVELVTADGVRRRIDADHDPELFWAVRGGGGDFGVVTALEFRVYPVAEIFAGTLFFPLERAEEVLQAWAAWSADRARHRDLGRSRPALPADARAAAVPVGPVVRGRRGGDPGVARAGRGTARAAARPRARASTRSTRSRSPSCCSCTWTRPAPIPGNGDGMLLTELPPDAVRAFVAAVGPDSGSTLLSAEIRHVGGALAPRCRARDGRGARHARARRRSPDSTPSTSCSAWASRRPTAADALAASLGRLLSRVEPWRAELDYLNFAEHERPAERLFGDRVHRLRALKDAIDPDGRHPLEPPGASLRGVSLAPSPS